MPFYFYKFFWLLACLRYQAVQSSGSTALDRPILEELINAYNSLGKKIFAFTNYVEKEWK
jgi:hypothetical protein